MKTILNLSTSMILVLALSGCLKTRAQLRSDSPESDGPQPIQAKVEEVKPQGGYVIDELKNEITRLTGRIEDLEREKSESAQSETTHKDTVQQLENRIRELEQAQLELIEAVKKQQASLPPPNPDEFYEKGKNEFGVGNYETAIEHFTTYLKAPNAARAEEAIFMRAESHYNLKQYKKAIVDYSKFPEKYSKSKKMPAALYKIGLSFEALGMKEDAKSFYQEIVDRYPRSSEAKKAKPKLR